MPADGATPPGEAERYLAFLASAGYQLSEIEQAIIDGMPYVGNGAAAELPGVTDGETTSGPTDPGPGMEGNADGAEVAEAASAQEGNEDRRAGTAATAA